MTSIDHPPARIAAFRRPAPALLAVALFALPLASRAAAVVRQGSGANPAEIQAIVDTFRADLGGVNNGVGGSFTSGRREINWDGVPDAFATPNFLPANFFNANSPRGIVFNTVLEDSNSALNRFSVSADSSNPSATAVRFGDLNAQYASIFQPFSAERLFTAPGSTIIEVTFFVPGTNEPAVVSGFGVVFADVDSSTGGGRTLIKCIDAAGVQLPGAASAGAANNGLSFVGVSYNAGEKAARCIIDTGNAGLSGSNVDGTGGVDVVAMDDFIYGEPLSLFRILEDGFE